MAIVAIDERGDTCVQRCEGCGAERTLRLHPKHGHVQDRPEDGVLVLAPCPECGGVECLRADIDAWEAGEEGEDGLPVPQPGSLTGQVLPGPPGATYHNVVHEHTIGGAPTPQMREHMRRIRHVVRRHRELGLGAHGRDQQPEGGE